MIKNGNNIIYLAAGSSHATGPKCRAGAVLCAMMMVVVVVVVVVVIV